MQDFLDGFKDFGAWLIITHLGRICLAGIIMFSGAILVNLDKSPILFYVGMALFCIEFVILFCSMIWNVIKDFL
jgi:hypothetical protein